jgi:hypothetical protein
MRKIEALSFAAIGAFILLAAVFTSAQRAAPVSGFSFSDDTVRKTLTLLDGSRGVLTFCYGDQLKPGVDPKQVRSGYIHPLFGLDGEVLTDDSPADHLHHHGLFWTWPIIRTRGFKTGTWEPATPPLRQQFVRWVRREIKDGAAALGVESVWKLDGKEIVARETADFIAHPAFDLGRFIDVSLVIEAVGGPLEFQGSQDAGKGYGGLCFRGAPEFKGAALTTDKGPQKEDAVNTTFRWADLSTAKGGIAVFVSLDHPGFPIPWLIRNSYAGILNPSWPGLKSATVEAGKSVTLRYRLYVHRGDAAAALVREYYSRTRTAEMIPGQSSGAPAAAVTPPR